MKRYVSLKLESHVLWADVQSAVWCPRCVLPSAITVPSMIVNADTLKVIDSSLLFVCNDCGDHRILPAGGVL